MALTYGIDLHGTLATRLKDGDGLAPSTLFPLLEPLMRALREQGERVFIVSGPPMEQLASEARSLGLKAGIHFDALISVVDFLRDREVPMREEATGWWCSDTDWDESKGWIAREYHIDIVIDDQGEYAEAMPDGTSFVRVSSKLLDE